MILRILTTILLLICCTFSAAAQTIEPPIVTYEEYKQLVEEKKKPLKANTIREAFDVCKEYQKSVKYFIDKENNIVEYYSIPKREYVELYGFMFKVNSLEYTLNSTECHSLEEVKMFVIKIRNESFPNAEIVHRSNLNCTFFKIRGGYTIATINGKIFITNK